MDWARIRRDLDERGYAKTPRVLSEDECGALNGLFGEEDRFRSVIDMRRLRFGSGVSGTSILAYPKWCEGFGRCFIRRSRR